MDTRIEKLGKVLDSRGDDAMEVDIERNMKTLRAFVAVFDEQQRDRALLLIGEITELARDSHRQKYRDAEVEKFLNKVDLEISKKILETTT